MQTIAAGARGIEVLFLQRMLNKHGASPQLAEDLDFGPRTREATIAFQRARSITPANGTVDGRTWNALGLAVEVSHNVRLFPQPTGMTCWSAAATMIVGNMSVGPGRAGTDGSGGLNPDIDNIEAFTSGLGWSLVNNQSAPPVASFLGHLVRSPLWLAFEGGTFKHAVVASALFTDRTDDGTVMRIHDPWPPNRGTVYGTTYVNRRVRLRSVSPASPAIIQYVVAPR
jgi:peptidoglycan hydrolase-like protein with peptidoglycan-binding domain